MVEWNGGILYIAQCIPQCLAIRPAAGHKKFSLFVWYFLFVVQELVIPTTINPAARLGLGYYYSNSGMSGVGSVVCVMDFDYMIVGSNPCGHYLFLHLKVKTTSS